MTFRAFRCGWPQVQERRCFFTRTSISTATPCSATDADALARIVDLADAPPPGTTVIITGDDDHGRGRYEGVARGIVRELEALGAIRSWGRLDLVGAGGWR